MAKLSIQLGLIFIVSATGVALAAPQHRGGGGGAVRGGGGAHFAAPHIAPRVSVSRVGAFRGHPRSTFHPRGNMSVAKHTTPYHPRRIASKMSSARVTASTRAVRSALHARVVQRALHSRRELRNPDTRSFITSRLATAGWREHDRDGGWWRHRHGGFGWVGPVFWPFAFFDLYDYVLWGPEYDDVFWDYGYGDVYVGLFAPYGYDDLTGYVVTSGRARSRVLAGQLERMCGEDTRDIAGIPIAEVRQSLRLGNEQNAALDGLADASAEAARIIKAACPTDIAVTAPERLAAMQARVEAMSRATRVVEPALDKFYGMLSDEQKARLNALGQRRSRQTAGSSLQSCKAMQSDVTQWPTAEIDRAVRPTEEQRVNLNALEGATSQAAERLMAACPGQEPLTLPARLAAVAERLNAMLQSVESVHTALNAFYSSLSDEQKAQFDAIGPKRTAHG
jgi:hypothetical protein